VIILTMPVYNEADGIEEFINELDRALPARVLLQVVDDASSDSTLARLESVDLPLGRLRILQNSVNVGHGPTTLRGLREALINDVDVVASIDGDGQFAAADVAGLLERLDEEWDVLEGCRFGRTDPWFRKVTSKVTAFLVALRCGRFPTDANTPLRIYRREVLEALLDGIPENFAVPNLLISARSRRRGLRVIEAPVRSRVRRGAAATGTTWGSRRASIPTGRFVRFCWRAFRQFWTVSAS